MQMADGVCMESEMLFQPPPVLPISCPIPIIVLTVWRDFLDLALRTFVCLGNHLHHVYHTVLSSIQNCVHQTSAVSFSLAFHNLVLLPVHTLNNSMNIMYVDSC